MIAPWLLGSFVLLIAFTIMQSIKAWRAKKHAPYFFMRRHAERRLKSYSYATMGLAICVGVSAFFTFRPPADTTERVVIISNAKPAVVDESVVDAIPINEIEVTVYDAPTAVEISALEAVPSVEEEEEEPDRSIPEPLDFTDVLSDEPLVSAAPELPTEFNQLDPEADLLPTTSFTSLIFSTEIDDEYEPISPSQIFGEGFFTVYATFFYEAMADGMEWAWVWRHNGDVVNGGNELWAYGDTGPGWVYYQPPEGFNAGEYSLEVWVNGELFGQSSITVEQGVANQ